MSLLLSIARCDLFLQGVTAGLPADHPCNQIVNWQAQHGIDRPQIPEPWNGDLERAPLLFVSSNPAINAQEHYPTVDWSDETVVRFFERRFGPEPNAPIANGVRIRNVDGTRSGANRFLAWVKSRAAELGCAEPGVGYAVTEVVHCKSSNEAEAGVGMAASVCLARYGRRVLELSGARAWIFVGAHAARSALELLPLTRGQVLYGPTELLGRERMVAFLPHPNSRMPNKTFAGRLLPEEFDRLREWLRR